MVSVAMVVGPTAGGIGRHVVALVDGLIQAGRRVDLYCPPAVEEQFGFAAAGARVTPLEITTGPGPRDIARLRRALRAEPVDVIHAHGLRAGLAAVLGRPGGAPLVVTWHSPAPGRGMRRYARDALARTVARGANVTLCASVEIQKEATDLGARDARLLMVVAAPLPAPVRERAEVREELGVPTDAPMILSVGRLAEQKRHDILIAAAGRWRSLRPLPVVVIAGKGPQYRHLVGRATVQRSAVHLVGHRDDVSELLHAADLVVVTSDAEGSPLFVQETMAAGVPLVATDVPGVAEMVDDAALLVPPDDIDAVDEAVRTLLADPGRRAVLSAAGRAMAATWPTPAQTLEQIISVYTDLAGGTVARDTTRR